MSRNVTYASRTPAVYANKREQMTTFGAADFPARVHIQSALDAAGLELEDDYEGTSHNPFMIEAFTAAIRSDNLDVFSQMPHKASVGRTALIGQRFGIDGKAMERVFDATINALPTMDNEGRRYYLASMFLSGERYLLEHGVNSHGGGVFTIVNAVNTAHRYGINNLFSVDKMVALHGVYNELLKTSPVTGRYGSADHDAKIELANRKLAFIAAFTVPEIKRIMTEFTADTYALPGRVKSGFGCKTLDEAINLIKTTNPGFLESMLPVL